MTSCELLSVEPQELQFPFELKKQSSCSLKLSNKTENYVAFRVKTTDAKKYRMKSNTGVVLPWTTCNVLVSMQAQKKAPSDKECKDKFLIQSVVVSPGTTTKDVTSEMFKKEAGHRVEESTLRVVYVTPSQPLVKKQSSTRASFSDKGGSLRPRIVLKPLVLELQFRFELEKVISCSFKLSNKVNYHAAFQFKTTNPEKYIVSPNTGVILPCSTCIITVTMPAQKKVPSRMKCKDMILVQCILVSPGVTTKDLTPEMFKKRAGHHVAEGKVRAAYVIEGSCSKIFGLFLRALVSKLIGEKNSAVHVDKTDLNKKQSF